MSTRSCARTSPGGRNPRLVIEELCARAGAAGLLRPGVTTDDLLLLPLSLGHAVQITDECRPQMWNRLLRISLDGLRADTANHFPPTPWGHSGW